MFPEVADHDYVWSLYRLFYEAHKKYYSEQLDIIRFCNEFQRNYYTRPELCNKMALIHNNYLLNTLFIQRDNVEEIELSVEHVSYNNRITKVCSLNIDLKWSLISLKKRGGKNKIELSQLLFMFLESIFNYSRGIFPSINQKLKNSLERGDLINIYDLYKTLSNLNIEIYNQSFILKFKRVDHYWEKFRAGEDNWSYTDSILFVDDFKGPFESIIKSLKPYWFSVNSKGNLPIDSDALSSNELRVLEKITTDRMYKFRRKFYESEISYNDIDFKKLIGQLILNSIWNFERSELASRNGQIYRLINSQHDTICKLEI